MTKTTVFHATVALASLLFGLLATPPASAGDRVCGHDPRHDIVVVPGRYVLRAAEVEEGGHWAVETRTFLIPGRTETRWVRVETASGTAWQAEQVTVPPREITREVRVWVPGRLVARETRVWVPGGFAPSCVAYGVADTRDEDVFAFESRSPGAGSSGYGSHGILGSTEIRSVPAVRTYDTRGRGYGVPFAGRRRTFDFDGRRGGGVGGVGAGVDPSRDAGLRADLDFDIDLAGVDARVGAGFEVGSSGIGARAGLGVDVDLPGVRAGVGAGADVRIGN
jgi:hypothetical protein